MINALTNFCAVRLTPEEEQMLRDEYEKYRARCNDLGSTTTRKPVFSMSFDDWLRAMADNAKDEAKYENE